MSKALALSFLGYLFIYLFILMFIFERERVLNGEGAEGVGGDRGSEAGSTLTAKSLMPVLYSTWDHDLSQIGCSTDWASHVPLESLGACAASYECILPFEKDKSSLKISCCRIHLSFKPHSKKWMNPMRFSLISTPGEEYWQRLRSLLSRPKNGRKCTPLISLL